MKKKFLLFLITFILIIPVTVKADYLVSYHSYGVTEQEKKLMEEEASVKRSFFQELKYRMIEKDTRDSVDYVILFILIALILTVIVALNKKTYVIPSSAGVFEEEPKIDEMKNLSKEKEKDK